MSLRKNILQGSHLWKYNWGLKWNIGNGKKVKVWKHRWLPTPESFKVVSPKPENTELECMEQLMDLERVAGALKR